jgi:hypothetical protein
MTHHFRLNTLTSTLLVVSLSSIACQFNHSPTAQKSTAVRSNDTFPKCKPGTCLDAIHSINDILALSIETSGLPFEARSIKGLYRRDKKGNGSIYFINTQNIPFHFDFVVGGLGIRVAGDKFNLNYTGGGSEREFNQFTLTYIPPNTQHPEGKTIWELWPGDTMDTHHMGELHLAIQGQFKMANNVKFHPLSARQEQMVAGSSIPTLLTPELFANVTYFPYNLGETMGYVTFLDEAIESQPCVDHTNIAVYKSVPNDIGLVAGVITEEIQTPLSHVSIKSTNRGTPNAAVKNANEILSFYKGKPVHIKFKKDGMDIKELDAQSANEQISKFWAAKNGTESLKLSFDLDPNGLKTFFQFSSLFSGIPTKDVHSGSIRKVGAKATNLALLTQAFPAQQKSELGVAVSDGFAVPFDFYEEFIQFKQTQLDATNPTREVSPQQLIQEILAKSGNQSTEGLTSICKVAPALNEIRSVLLKSKIPDSLITQFKKVIFDDPASPIHLSKIPRIRLRSSTNSEDLAGFTGAGLYNSEGVSLYKKLPTGGFDASKPNSWAKIESELREKLPIVYSSAWNDRAFAEREWFGIRKEQHHNVKVGIAVHRAYAVKDFSGTPGEQANGVLITTNPFVKNSEFSTYINGQHWDLAVTNPPTDEELLELGQDPNLPYSTEEVLVTTANAQSIPSDQGGWKLWSTELRATTSVNQGKSVLMEDFSTTTDSSKMEARRLARVSEILGNMMARIYRQDPSQFPVDIEWKIFGPDRKIYIKQVRPYVKN